MADLNPQRFDLSSLDRASRDEVCEFIVGLAQGDPDALQAVGVREGEGPFERLATFWSVSSGETRAALVEGLKLVFDEIGVPMITRLGSSATDTLQATLGFCATITPDLQPDQQRLFSRFLTHWLEQEHQPHSEIAAAALCAMTIMESLIILESRAKRLMYPQWLLTPLLERRATGDPFSVLNRSEDWLPGNFEDVKVQAALQDGVQAMLERDPAETCRVLAVTFDRHRGPVATSLRKVVVELPLDDFPTIDALVRGYSSNSTYPPTELVGSLETIMRKVEQSASERDLAKLWYPILERLAEQPSEIASRWGFVRNFAQNTGRRPEARLFMKSLRRAMLNPALPRELAATSLLREVQREHHDASLTADAATDDAIEKIILARLGNRRKLKANDPEAIPPRIRIPVVGYAEEAFVEVLRLLLRAHFPKLTVEPVGNVAWDELDKALDNDLADIGLNNNDILSEGDLRPELQLYRLGGDPLYRVEGLPLLANASFLQKNGVPKSDIVRAQSERAALFGALSPQTAGAALANLMKVGDVSVPRGTRLVHDLARVAEAHGVRTESVQPETSDIGLIDFLSGDRDMYFGGALHSQYALNSSDDAVFLCEIDAPLEGRLFAREGFYDKYPDFMDDLAALANEIDAVFKVRTKGYLDNFHDLLTRRVNEALYSASAQHIAVVTDYEELESALRNSKLIPSRQGKRSWQPWTTDSGRADRPQVYLATDNGRQKIS
jgi:hypothetical protein